MCLPSLYEALDLTISISRNPKQSKLNQKTFVKVLFNPLLNISLDLPTWYRLWKTISSFAILSRTQM